MRPNSFYQDTENIYQIPYDVNDSNKKRYTNTGFNSIIDENYLSSNQLFHPKLINRLYHNIDVNTNNGISKNSSKISSSSCRSSSSSSTSNNNYNSDSILASSSLLSSTTTVQSAASSSSQLADVLTVLPEATTVTTTLAVVQQNDADINNNDNNNWEIWHDRYDDDDNDVSFVKHK